MTFKELRKRSGLTQIQFANKINVNQSAVSMWETGRSAPRINMLPRISNAIGCTVDELLSCFAAVKEG